jgi:serine phosphatase RsbU (regulator of sigma subunit)
LLAAKSGVAADCTPESKRIKWIPQPAPESNLEDDRTQIVTFARSTEPVPDERIRCVELIDGFDVGRRFVIGLAGASIGRTLPAEIVLPDAEVSRVHCRLAIRGDDLVVVDLGSTNGTFVDGVRISEPTSVSPGSIIRVGQQLLKHEWRTRREIQQSEELDRDLRKANSYVRALLPEPLAEGPIKSDWHYEPCAKLGGDAFGYGVLSGGQFIAYIIDVSGHGAGAAMHSVAVMNLLRQRALPGADLSKPAEVLATLNSMFQMDSHDGMYFTMWYGVYDTASRRLEYATAGHHAGFLVPPDRNAAVPMRTRGGLIGADPATVYRSDSIKVPPGSAIYLFSDGVFEIVTIEGVEWGLNDFVPILLQPPAPGLKETQRLYREARGAARPGLDDDFSLVVLDFE